jgi:hypothetical protein
MFNHYAKLAPVQHSADVLKFVNAHQFKVRGSAAFSDKTNRSSREQSSVGVLGGVGRAGALQPPVGIL